MREYRSNSGDQPQTVRRVVMSSETNASQYAFEFVMDANLCSVTMTCGRHGQSVLTLESYEYKW